MKGYVSVMMPNLILKSDSNIKIEDLKKLIDVLTVIFEKYMFMIKIMLKSVI